MVSQAQLLAISPVRLPVTSSSLVQIKGKGVAGAKLLTAAGLRSGTDTLHFNHATPLRNPVQSVEAAPERLERHPPRRKLVSRNIEDEHHPSSSRRWMECSQRREMAVVLYAHGPAQEVGDEMGSRPADRRSKQPSELHGACEARTTGVQCMRLDAATARECASRLDRYRDPSIRRQTISITLR